MQEFTSDQIYSMDEQLSREGYVNVGEWMQDSDYIFDEDAGEWYDEDDNGPYDPYSQYFIAKEAESEALLYELDKEKENFDRAVALVKHDFVNQVQGFDSHDMQKAITLLKSFAGQMWEASA